MAQIIKQERVDGQQQSAWQVVALGRSFTWQALPDSVVRSNRVIRRVYQVVYPPLPSQCCPVLIRMRLRMGKLFSPTSLLKSLILHRKASKRGRLLCKFADARIHFLSRIRYCFRHGHPAPWTHLSPQFVHQSILEVYLGCSESKSEDRPAHHKLSTTPEGLRSRQS